MQGRKGRTLREEEKGNTNVEADVTSKTSSMVIGTRQVITRREMIRKEWSA
jgi:hypothetical protein